MQHLNVNFSYHAIIQDKEEYAKGEVHLPFSTQSYSYALPLLLS
jgi:hypothetical protein